MEEILEYLKQCGTFFIAVAVNERPFVRPFTEVCGFEGRLYFMVRKSSDMYIYLAQSRAVDICALHLDKSWISIAGELTEDNRPAVAAAIREDRRNTLSTLHTYTGAEGDTAAFFLRRGKAVVSETIGVRQEWEIR